MAKEIASVYVTIGAQTGKLEAALKSTKQQLGDVGNTSKSAMGQLASGISKAGMAMGAVTAAVGALGVAFDQVMELGKAGAELEYARGKFDKLAGSIGTVSSALMDDLRGATKGLVSDAQLVGSAGDFMALGLAKSHDEVVRLTRVAGALGMDMNQLVLTLTNQTTMRFDALGVSVAGFDEKVKALEATGMSASEAFNEAFLQQAEAQIQNIGDKADSSAAAFARLEAASANLADALKMKLAPSLADAADAAVLLLTMQDQIAGALDKHEGEVRTTAASYAAYVDEQKRAAEAAGYVVREVNGQVQVLRRAGTGFEDVTGEIIQLTEAEFDGIRAAQEWNSDAREQLRVTNALAGSLQTQASATTKSANATSAYTERMTAQAEAYGHNTRRLWEMNAGLEQYKKLQEDAAAAAQTMADAQTNYNVTMQKFSEGYAGDVVSALQAAGVSGEKYEKALEAVDKQNGTNFLGQYKATQSLDEAARKYRSGEMTLEEFSAALATNKSEWEALDENVQNAKSALDSAKESFDALMQDIASWSGKTFRIQITTTGAGGGGGGGSKITDTAAGETGIGGTTPVIYTDTTGTGGGGGGQGTIDSDDGRGSGGRTRPGTTGGGGMTIHIGQIVLPNVHDGKEFIRAMRGGVISGAGYAGG